MGRSSVCCTVSSVGPKETVESSNIHADRGSVSDIGDNDAKTFAVSKVRRHSFAAADLKRYVINEGDVAVHLVQHDNERNHSVHVERKRCRERAAGPCVSRDVPVVVVVR